MQTDEYQYLVVVLPDIDTLRVMMEPDANPAGQFFEYVALSPCGREHRRTAVLTDLTIVGESVTLVIATELFDLNEDPEFVQRYMEGVIEATFTLSGELDDATITLDGKTEVEGPHPLFAERPETVAVGA